MNQKHYWFGNFACTLNGVVGVEGKQLMISNELDWNYVHHLRSEITGIVVGSGTVINEDPNLLTKKQYVEYPQHPIRIIFDRSGRTSELAQVFQQQDLSPTIWVTNSEETRAGITKIPYTNLTNTVERINYELRSDHIQVMVEGGPTLMTAFVNANILRELRIFRSTKIAQGRDMFSGELTNPLRLLTVTKMGDGIEERYSFRDQDITDSRLPSSATINN